MPSSERDGCGCPSQVKLCAHWNGLVLVLSERFATPAHPFAFKAPFGVVLGGPWLTCGCHGLRARRGIDNVYVLDFDTFPAAEAEFRRREAAMLGREES